VRWDKSPLTLHSKRHAAMMNGDPSKRPPKSVEHLLLGMRADRLGGERAGRDIARRNQDGVKTSGANPQRDPLGAELMYLWSQPSVSVSAASQHRVTAPTGALTSLTGVLAESLDATGERNRASWFSTRHQDPDKEGRNRQRN
jgi:hypothetical protein